ncbi:MAG: hypothetical protein AAF702_20025 [Chloroflexota bacterium]
MYKPKASIRFTQAVLIALILNIMTGRLSSIFAWNLAEQITSSAADSYNPSAVIDSNGTTHVVWLQNVSGDESEDIFYTSGDTDEWQSEINISNSTERSLNVQLAITSDDKLLAVWTEILTVLGQPIGSLLYYSTYELAEENGSTGWSTPAPLPSQTLVAGIPFLATHNGEVHVVWGVGELLTGYADRIYHAVWDGANWIFQEALPLQTGFLDIADIVFDATGQLHLAWNGNQTSAGNVHTDYQIYYTTRVNGNWSTPVNISNTSQYSFYPSLAVDIEGRVHVTWMEEDLNELGLQGHIFDRILYNRMENGIWLPQPIKISAISGAIFPTMAVDPLGYVHMIWANDILEGLSSVQFRLHYARWDSNDVYGPLQIVDAPGENQGQGMATFALPASGWLDPSHQNIVWSGGANNDISQIFFSKQLPYQVSLADLVAPSNLADFPTVAGTSQTDLHAVWIQNTGNIQILYSHWDGIRWENPSVISLPDSVSTNPEVAVGADGMPHVVWQAYTDEVDTRTYYSRLSNSGWLTPTQISDGFGAEGMPDIAIDNDGNLHVMWQTGAKAFGSFPDIWYRRTSGGIDQWQDSERMFLPGHDIRNPQLAIDGSGSPHVVWYNVDDAEVGYAKRTESGWTPYENVSNSDSPTIDLTSNAPGIAVDANNRVHIAWKDSVSGTQLDTIYYATRETQGWQRQVIMSEPERTHNMDQVSPVNVDVLASPDGDVHLLWHDLGPDGSRQIYTSNNLGRASGQAWSSPTIITPSTPTGARPRGYLDETGHLHIVWNNLTGNNQIFYAEIERFDWLKVVDESGRTVPDATIYRNGSPVAQSNSRGLIFLDNLNDGDELVTLAPVAEHPGVRGGHTSPDSPNRNWAYRIYSTNWSYSADGVGNRVGVSAKPLGSEQLLTVHSESPLILLNLVVSLEWAASDEYAQTFAQAMRLASNYLFDATNGQMAIGHVAIYREGQFWGDADIQVRAFNGTRPNAGINGLRNPLVTPIRLGRSWSGKQNDDDANGPWDHPEGYRTIIHELGHYAFGLWDSYFKIIRNEDGTLRGYDYSVSCISESIRGPENINDTTNATLMDYQYNATEFSMVDTESWSDNCRETQQFQENFGESDWETIVRFFNDSEDPALQYLSNYTGASWQLQTPQKTGLLSGPTIQPLLNFPEIVIAPIEQTTKIPLQLVGPERATQLAAVTLYVQRGDVAEAIDQGYTNRFGQISLLGARSGDSVRVLSRDTTYRGEMSLQAGITNTLTLELTNPLVSAAQRSQNQPLYLRVLPGSQNRSLDLQVIGITAGASIDGEYTLTGRDVGAEVKLGFNAAQGEYRGTLAPDLPAEVASLDGLGQVRIVGTDINDQPIYLAGSLSTSVVQSNMSQLVASPDGGFQLLLPVEGIEPNTQPYLLISEHNVFGIPADLTALSPVYQMRLSGAIGGFNTPIAMTIYSSEGVTKTGEIQIHRYDEAIQRWKPLMTTWDNENHVASTSNTATGFYALLATTGQIQDPTSTPTSTPTITSTLTPTSIPTFTPTPTPANTATFTPTPTTTSSKPLSPTLTLTSIATPVVATNTPIPTATLESTPTITVSPTATSTVAKMPSLTPSVTTTTSPRPTATPTVPTTATSVMTPGSTKRKIYLPFVDR